MEHRDHDASVAAIPDAKLALNGGEGRARALPGRQILTQSVYEVVKAQIMDLELAPGARINMDQLARNLEVSNTPLREALTKLESEGLVTRRSLQGYRVAPLPDEHDLEELFRLRVILETEAARCAAANAEPSLLAALSTSVEQMVQPAGAPESGEQYRRYRALVSFDAFFHDAIAQASGDRLLRRTLAGLHSHVLQYRLYFRTGRAPEGHETAKEHTAIVEALEGHDPKEAASAMQEHLERSTRRIITAHRMMREVLSR